MMILIVIYENKLYVMCADAYVSVYIYVGICSIYMYMHACV